MIYSSPVVLQLWPLYDGMKDYGCYCKDVNFFYYDVNLPKTFWRFNFMNEHEETMWVLISKNFSTTVQSTLIHSHA